MMDVTVVVSCDECWKKIDLEDESNCLCNECADKKVNFSDVKAAMIHSASHDYEWKDKDYHGFKSAAEQETFLKGLKAGFSSALFWIGDYFGDEGVAFFEKEIGHNFEGFEEKKEIK